MSSIPNFSTDLTGQTAFVTGTTSGLGRRFAEVLAACGARPASVAGRREDRLNELAQELSARGAGNLTSTSRRDRYRSSNYVH